MIKEKITEKNVLDSWNDELSFIKKIFNIEERMKEGKIWNYLETENSFGNEVLFSHVDYYENDSSINFKITKQKITGYFFIEKSYCGSWRTKTQKAFDEDKSNLYYHSNLNFCLATKSFSGLVAYLLATSYLISYKNISCDKLPSLYESVLKITRETEKTAFPLPVFEFVFDNFIGIIFLNDKNYGKRKKTFRSVVLPEGVIWSNHTRKIEPYFANKVVFQGFVDFITTFSQEFYEKKELK